MTADEMRYDLQVIASWIEPEARVLDLGCGTGVLSLAAVLFGAPRCLGVDVDPEAISAAQQNAVLNNLQDRALFRLGSSREGSPPYSLVLANLVGAVLFNAGGEIPILLSPGGIAVVSGFSGKQSGDVQTFFSRRGAWVLKERRESGWAALLLAT